MIDSIAGIDLETKVRIFLDNTLAVRQILDKDNALNLQDDLENILLENGDSYYSMIFLLFIIKY